MHLFDTHVHLADEAFVSDLDAVIGRASDAGVQQMVVIGIDATTCEQSLKIAASNGFRCSAGIHPSEAAKATEVDYARIETLLSGPLVVAVGEIGLDFYWPDPPPAPQYEVLRKMLSLASKYSKPVIIHQRNSAQELLKVIDEFELSAGGVFHCFSGDESLAREVIRRGFHVSAAGNVTYKKANWSEVLRSVRKDRLLIETDAPYLSPVPYRGKRNEPAHLTHTAFKVSEILGLTIEETAELTTRNAQRLFDWKN